MVFTDSWFVGEDFGRSTGGVEGVVGVATPVAHAHEILTSVGIEIRAFGVEVEVPAIGTYHNLGLPAGGSTYLPLCHCCSSYRGPP